VGREAAVQGPAEVAGRPQCRVHRRGAWRGVAPGENAVRGAGAGEGHGWAGRGRGLPPRAAAPGVLSGGPAVRAAAGWAAEAEPARAGDVGCGERSCPASSRVVGDDVPDDTARRTARGGPANTPEHGDLVRAAAAERAACVGGGGVAGSDGWCCGAARCRAAGNQSMQTSVIERFVRY
jgi:hypothetical protein